MKRQFWTVDRIVWLILGLGVATGLIYLLGYLSDALLPFFAACFIAYLLQPLVELNRRWTREKGRVWSSVLALAEVGVVIVGVGYIFIPQAVSEFNELAAIVHALASGKANLPPEYAAFINFFHDSAGSWNFERMIAGGHLSALLQHGSSLLGQSVSAVIGVLSWALGLIYLIFIVIYYPQTVRGFKLIIPGRYRQQGLAIMHDVADSMNHYFRGQGKLSLCAIVLYSIGFSIVGFPLAIPMGFLVGLLYMIPYFQYITVIPVAAVCLIYSLGGHGTFWHLFGASLLVYAIVQPTCDYIITPHIMGKEMGLNPAMILLALSVWGSLLGILGMIIALPATSLIISYYERYISNPAPRAPKEGPE